MARGSQAGKSRPRAALPPGAAALGLAADRGSPARRARAHLDSEAPSPVPGRPALAGPGATGTGKIWTKPPALAWAHWTVATSLPTATSHWHRSIAAEPYLLHPLVSYRICYGDRGRLGRPTYEFVAQLSESTECRMQNAQDDASPETHSVRQFEYRGHSHISRRRCPSF